jgi:TatD DNase family protein
MSYLIDSHCHLHEPKYFPEPQKTILEASENGIKKIITVGTSLEDNSVAREIAVSHKNIFWSFGLHPSEITGDEEFPEIVQSEKLVAIGEVGLDYHYQPYNRALQMATFEKCIQLAIRSDLPVIFHVREAFEDFFEIVDKYPGLRAVVHSFSDNAENLQKCLDRGFYIGVNGLSTFAFEIPLPPLEKMLLETDAPYLAPVPYRGKPNAPKNIRNIAEFIAERTGVNYESVVKRTTENAERLFKI